MSNLMQPKNRLLQNETQLLVTAVMTRTVADRQDAMERLRLLRQKQALTEEMTDAMLAANKITRGEYDFITEG